MARLATNTPMADNLQGGVRSVVSVTDVFELIIGLEQIREQRDASG